MNKESVTLGLSAAADKLAVSPKGGTRHIVFTLRVSRPVTECDRQALKVALVLDRSGSMHGGKIEAAKKAANLLVGVLDERDEVSVVCFDEKIDILVPPGRVTAEHKNRAAAAVLALEARGSTALHAGWLTGCRGIAGSEPAPERISHCFLLTDGLANVGEQDRERIAAEAAGVRQNAGIRTSTFGIGDDYDEAMLGPMAVAGGGQFHHLRNPDEIAAAFAGELGELFNTAARNVRIEITPPRGVKMDMISGYYFHKPEPRRSRVVIEAGDLMAGEERRIVLRLRVPGLEKEKRCPLVCRLHWSAEGRDHQTDAGEIVFEGASDKNCSAIKADPEALHWIGLHHAARTKKTVLGLFRDGNIEEARKILHAALKHLREYAGEDRDLKDAVADLESLEPHIESGILEACVAKEQYFQSSTYLQGRRDLRGGSGGGTKTGTSRRV